MQDSFERLKDARKKAGFAKAVDAAREFGWNENTYRSHENGVRNFDLEWAERYGRAFKCDPLWLLIGRGERPGNKNQGDHVRVIGNVQAGVWLEAVQWEADDHRELPLIRDAGMKNAYALCVRGDSMDLYYREGDYLIVVPLEDFGRELKSGDHVIVERRKKDGIAEATVKELVIAGRKAELWPRSQNSKFKKPLNIFWPYRSGQSREMESVQIKGVVHGSYRDLKFSTKSTVFP